MPRKIAMYLGQKIGDYRLNEMASFFGLCHYGGVSSAIYSVVGALKLDEVLSKKINDIINRLDNLLAICHGALMDPPYVC